MRITAYKYQSTGNDFIILDNRDGSITLSEDQIKKLCHRRFGIGADGLMLLNSSKKYNFAMKYYNSDGREGTMCGNGGRALVTFAAHKGIKKYQFEAIDGVHNANVISYSPSTCVIKLEMIDVNEVNDYSPKSYFLNTGSSHLVIFVENVNDYDVLGQGKLWRSHPSFPDGTNVDFVQGGWGRFNLPKFEEDKPQVL
ncbi:MAG TPA: diaminopimelate epimerase, partial [Bacteroidales bacterium]|nr:diaminopimelate epimerase [Bacteroidales bacterium]